MGQEIFDCGSCEILPRSRDLEKGQAVRSGDPVFCGSSAAAQDLPQGPPPSTPRMSETERILLGVTPRAPRPAPPPAPASRSQPFALSRPKPEPRESTGTIRGLVPAETAALRLRDDESRRADVKDKLVAARKKGLEIWRAR